MARNQAPVAGAIRWSRSLFARCKRTHVLLSAMEPSLLQESSGRQARTPTPLVALAAPRPGRTLRGCPLSAPYIFPQCCSTARLAPSTRRSRAC